MATEGLDDRRGMRCASRDEETVPGLQNAVRSSDELAGELLSGLSSEGTPQAAESTTREAAVMRLARVLVRCALRKAKL